jgi:hypothetical protein
MRWTCYDDETASYVFRQEGTDRIAQTDGVAERSPDPMERRETSDPSEVYVSSALGTALPSKTTLVSFE